MANPPPPLGTLHPHPSDEFLISYVTGTLATNERADVERHVDTCDDCVRTLTTMRRRLAIADEFAAPVPATVAARGLQSLTGVAQAENPTRSLAPWVTTIREKLTALVRFPVLVPVAVAAAAVLLVITRGGWSPMPDELTRSSQIHQQLRVTAPETVMRVQPSPEERAISTLPRGTDVEVLERSGEWFRVQVGGKEGWIERHAFE